MYDETVYAYDKSADTYDDNTMDMTPYVKTVTGYKMKMLTCVMKV